MSVTPAPPQLADRFSPRRLSGWPQVIGIIAIVFGALGLLVSCGGPIMTALVHVMDEVMPEGQSNPFAAMVRYQVAIWVLSAVSFLIALLLLVAGMGLVKRRPHAPTLCIVWAVLKTLFVLGKIYFDWVINRDVNADMASQGMAAMSAGAASTLTIVFIALAVLWALALPVFMMIWFARESVRTEVRTW